MAENITVARPYAEAVFRVAQQAKRLDSWSQLLAILAAAFSETDVATILTHPSLGVQSLEKLLLEALGGLADDDVKRFIATLTANHRLSALPEIAKQFEQLKAEAEGRLEAIVETAFPLTPERRRQ